MCPYILNAICLDDLILTIQNLCNDSSSVMTILINILYCKYLGSFNEEIQFTQVLSAKQTSQWIALLVDSLTTFIPQHSSHSVHSL